MNDGAHAAKTRFHYLPHDDTELVFRRIDERLTTIELTLAKMETERAVGEEKRKFMEARFINFDSRLDRIDGHISRLVWLIFTAILGGFMSFVLRGGIIGG